MVCRHLSDSFAPRWMESLAWRVSRWERQEGAGEWSHLPADLLQRALRTVRRRDVCSAAGVCRAWRDAVRPLQDAHLALERGKVLLRGEGGGGSGEPDLGMALVHFEEAAALGNSKGMVDAGLVLWKLGRYADAVRWYKEAAELGEPVGVCNLGLALWRGEGVGRDSQAAVGHFRRAALAGNTRAQSMLGTAYKSGRGVPRPNDQGAVYWWGLAAQGGCSKAMFNLAMEGARGGEGQGARVSEGWLRSAAEAGHADAMLEWGLRLLEGGHSDHDQSKGLMYLKLATEYGCEGAGEEFGRAMADADPSIVGAAWELHRAWRPAQLRKSKGRTIQG